LTKLKFENTPKSLFFIFHLNETGHLIATACTTALRAAVQPPCISLQNFALCEIADRLQSPTARLGCWVVCTTSGFAKKTDAKPVGGRGISAFSAVFFVEAGNSLASQEPTEIAASRSNDVMRCGGRYTVYAYSSSLRWV